MIHDSSICVISDGGDFSKFPIANAVGSVFFCVGSILYKMGYSDTKLDVNTARFKKGGGIKYIGLFTALYSTGAFAYSLITSA